MLKHPHRTAFGFRALGVVGLQRLRLGIEEKRLRSLDSEARAMVKIGGRDRGSSESRAGRLNISSQDIEALCSKPYT